MKGFKLDEKGDVVIQSGDIAMIDGNDLTRQSVEQVVGTNKGEWFLNEDEGIDFFSLLTKNPDEAIVRDEIAGALQQVDDTFYIRDFTMEQIDRNLRIKFTALNDNGETIGGEQNYGS